MGQGEGPDAQSSGSEEFAPGQALDAFGRVLEAGCSMLDARFWIHLIGILEIICGTPLGFDHMGGR